MSELCVRVSLETGWMLLTSFMAGVLSTMLLGLLASSQTSLRFGLLAFSLLGYCGSGLVFLPLVRWYARDLKSQSPLEELVSD